MKGRAEVQESKQGQDGAGECIVKRHRQKGGGVSKVIEDREVCWRRGGKDGVLRCRMVLVGEGRHEGGY